MKHITRHIYEGMIYDDSLKTDKPLSREQERMVEEFSKLFLSDTIFAGQILNTGKFRRSRIFVMDKYIDIYDTLNVVVCGGLNGCGSWNDYFRDLGRMIDELGRKGIRTWLINCVNDCCDDVFYCKFGIEKS